MLWLEMSKPVRYLVLQKIIMGDPQDFFDKDMKVKYSYYFLILVRQSERVWQKIENCFMLLM
ncbi:hypothetical protein PAHAL_5G462200 [Panicum hallii]|jgi:hypothetical protein|uniref:Uncharacterized protein n=1 Tax=Panicum hallii TaxID=206008 RepID=A0A2T8INI3_9POAL|nr:hypothetical protein PAHAL_5G462200 [Panicum hallii]